MPQKTISLTPTAWAVRAEPPPRLSWAPTIGSADLFAAHDADVAVCANTTGAAYDSDSIDAKGFKDAVGALPVFEVDARNPLLTIKCYMATGDGKNAGPFIYVFDTADLSGTESLGPFDTVNAAGWYTRVSAWPSMGANNIFTSMAAGRFALSCIFPSRPADAGTPSINFQWDAALAELTYTYGPNTTPNAFNFVDAAGVAAANVLSNVVNITGIDTPQLVSIAGHASAVFSVNGDAFSAVARNISTGQTLQLRMTAPAGVGNHVDCVVTVETRTDAWRVTTGSDVPSTSLGAPADLVNCIPGWLVPDAGVTTGQTFFYQPRGNTIPMPFYFEWGGGVQGVQYSLTAATGPWTDGAVPGACPVNGNIWIRCLAPNSNGSVTGYVRLRYTSAATMDETLVKTGAAGFIYKVDLSPVDSFEAAGPAPVKHWAPTPSGLRHHVSAALGSTASGTVFTTVSTYIDVGRWWRRADSSVMPWPVGITLKGVDYGGLRSHTYPLAVADAVTSVFHARNPGDTAWTQLAGSDAALTLNATVFLNGGASPGVTPTGWTLPALLDALIGDTFRMGRRVGFKDTSGQVGDATVRTHVLRVFFEVVRPPEGMTWEI